MTVHGVECEEQLSDRSRLYVGKTLKPVRPFNGADLAPHAVDPLGSAVLAVGAGSCCIGRLRISDRLGAYRQDLFPPATIAIDGDPLAAEVIRQPEHLFHLRPGCIMRKFTVLETALSVYSWKAACILICHFGSIS